MANPDERRSAGMEQTGADALAVLAAGARGAAAAAGLDEALHVVVAAVAEAVGAHAAVARILAPDGRSLDARAVVSSSSALAAELAGSRLPADGVAARDDAGAADAALSALSSRAGAGPVLRLPVRADGALLGTLELFRRSTAFTERDYLLARLAADQLAAALRAFAGDSANGGPAAPATLELVGEALAAGSDGDRIAEEIARLAAVATSARSGVVWRVDGVGLRPVGGHRVGDRELAAEARARVERVLADPAAARTRDDEALTLALGEPPRHALQLWFPAGTAPPTVSPALRAFAARAAHALRTREHARTTALELDRARELLGLAARLHAELSLAHRLDPVLERVGELLGAARAGVYVREGGRLVPVAVRGVDGPHAAVAERLLDLALGPFRGHDALTVASAEDDVRLSGVADNVAAAQIEGAVAVPLIVGDEVTGLLAVYVRRGRALTAHEEALVTALAAQLAVALQNSRLHERATRLGAELESVLALERRSARRLAALYEISRSFVESMADAAAPLDATLSAIVRSVVDLVGADAAAISLPDGRREQLLVAALEVADAALAPALRPILGAPEALEKLPGRRLLRQGRPLVLDAETAAALGGAHTLLVPFLAKGATAVVLPIRSAGDLLGTLKLLSLEATRPLTDEAVEIGLSVAAQAGLAIDNARLYEHQKFFTESMQRSLLPTTLPTVSGFRVGTIYAASSQVELGGDVYDYLLLPDGRLAVVLGDVTGHGVEAAAEMAMAKFVFRSLAREHPEPAAFLAAANDVVYGELAAAKFITMLYLVVDPGRGAVACASAGHPAPRVVEPDGSVRALAAGGLALGIEPGQTYEAVDAELQPGASVVLYTDGVVEARRGGELYGSERLDALLARRAALSPQDLAAAVIADCRTFAGGDLQDDCALVVVRRTAA